MRAAFSLLARFRRPPRLGPAEAESRSLWRINKVYWTCIAVVLGWAVLRTFGVGGPLPVAHLAGFYAVIGVAALNLSGRSLAALARSRGRVFDDRLGWIFTVVDLACVAAGVRLTGGADSGLWIVLFVLVVAETILSPRNEAWLVRWAAGISLVAGTLTPLLLGEGAYWLDLATRLFFLVVVSMITRRLRERHDAERAELATLRAELAAAGERTRLSREIHDGVGNALAAAVLRLEVAARVSDKQPGVAADGSPALLREEAQALRQAMDQVRDWTFFTRPWPAGDRENFGAVLSREAARFGQRTGLPVIVEGANALDDLPEPARVAALRITQEALTNAAKYAEAVRVIVRVERQGKWLCLVIEDDGRGFDPAETPFPGDGHRPGMGLTGMRERAESLGGRLDVSAAPNQGVTISARLPVA